MPDAALDRALNYRLALAYDCWGRKRHVPTSIRGGRWALDTSALDLPEQEQPPTAPPDRIAALRRLASSGRFTAAELRTLHAMVAGLSIAEIAAREGCTRQAIMARLRGNSRGQGGLVRKAATLGPTCGEPTP